MLAAVVVLLGLALVATSLQLWRAYRLIHALEGILADEVDRVRSLELQLHHSRTLRR